MDFDEVRRRAIVALFSDDALSEELVLKGGNAISLIYGLGNRASLDLDFSIETDFADLADTEKRIFRALGSKFEEVGFSLFDTKFGPRPQEAKANSDPRWGGYQFEFKLIEQQKEAGFSGNIEAIRRNAVVVGPNQMRRFMVDLSKYEFCSGKIEKELDHYTIYVYTPEMIVVEKLRAICQQMPEYPLNANKRARARDFYDIHLVIIAESMNLTTDANLMLLEEVFLAKEVSLDLLKDIQNQYESNRLDWPAVRDSVSASLNDFDFYFDFVLEQASRISKALGIK